MGSPARPLSTGERKAVRSLATSWPHDISHEPAFAIGAVVKILARDFPATTVSKVRFLEEKGLVSPHRSASGYRKYSLSDIERIRYILTEQRDSYAPLRVIHENLQALEAGHDADPIRRTQIVTNDGKSIVPSGRSTISTRELSDLTGTSRETLEEYVKLGLITPDLGGHFRAKTVNVVSLINRLAAAGTPVRNLRSVKNGADRSADIVDQMTLGVARRDRPGDRERAAGRASELAELFSELHSEYLHAALAAVSE
mgnify:CR=1 FL=1